MRGFALTRPVARLRVADADAGAGDNLEDAEYAEEEAAVQEDVPVIEALDVKSKTAQLIADIKARAFAAARSSPEQPRKELDDLSDSDSESSSDDSDGPGLVAQLMQDAKGKAKA